MRCKMEVTVSPSFSSQYYQLTHVNSPCCYKFLLNEHWLPCLSFASSPLYLMPQPALRSRFSPFLCACYATIQLHRLHAFSPTLLLPISFPYHTVSTSPGKLFENASHLLTETMAEAPGIARTVSLSHSVPDAISPCQAATICCGAV